MKICSLICFSILFLISILGCREKYYFGLSKEIVCYGIPSVSGLIVLGILLIYIHNIIACFINVFHILTCCYFKKTKPESEYPYYTFV